MTNLQSSEQSLVNMKDTLDAVSSKAQRAADTLITGFSRASGSSQGFQRTLGSIIANLEKMGGGLLEQGLSSLFGGGSPAGLKVTPFADGGIVSRPTLFGGSNGSVGLMGERGAEAIMPLARGPDGRLGVASNGQQKAANITINIATNDAESFRKSQVQITSALARAVARGQRGL